VSDYRIYVGPRRGVANGLLEAPTDTVAEFVAGIVDTEGPVHESEVIARVCDLWNTRAGSRIQDSVRAAISLAVRNRRILRRGPFYWRPDGACAVRSRAATGIPADRIAPEEYAEAVKLILAGGNAFERSELIAEVRALMGYSRTGAILEQTIGTVVDALLLQGTLGEASGGLTLRATTNSGAR
jgi:hypothetical protein